MKDSDDFTLMINRRIIKEADIDSTFIEFSKYTRNILKKALCRPNNISEIKGIGGRLLAVIDNNLFDLGNIS